MPKPNRSMNTVKKITSNDPRLAGGSNDQVFAPIMSHALVIDERVLAQRRECFGECLVIVVQPLVAEPRVVVQIVVLLQPANGGLYALIVRRQPGIDHALEPGISH